MGAGLRKGGAVSGCPWCLHPKHAVCRLDRQVEWRQRVGILAANIRAAALEEMRVRAAVERVRDMWSMA
jgi:hypothetical protein